MLKDLNNLAPEIKELTDKAKQFGTSSSPAMKSLVDTVKNIQEEWEGLKDSANEREEQLESGLKHAQNFQAQLDKMLLWLQLTEDKLEGLNPDATDQDSVAKKLKEAQALQGDMMKMSYDQELLNREGKSLMDSVDSEKGQIKVRLEDVGQRWEALSEGLLDSLTFQIPFIEVFHLILMVLMLSSMILEYDYVVKFYIILYM